MFGTVLDLADASAGIPPFLVYDSVSLVPYLDDPNQAPLRTYAYTEEFTGMAWPAPNTNGHATIRNDRYKLIWRYTATDELYDLVADPWENTNLINSTNATVVQNKNDLLAEINRLRAGGGKLAENFRVFGQSTCPGWFGPPTIAASGNPTPGGSFTMSLTLGPPLGGLAYALLGFSWTAALGHSLPIGLGQFGSHQDCVLSSSPDLVQAVTTNTIGNAQLSVAIPLNTHLIDIELLGAWLCLDNSAPNNPLHLVSTKSVVMRIDP